MSNKDYGELFCQAVDEIIARRLEGVTFDTTILCTIVDDSKRDKGIYTVNNGNAKFDAVSAVTSYRNKDNVYVQIPGGDMNEQKIIIAKKTDKSTTPYVYQRPFSTLVDITGNLINSNVDSNETGLRANAFTENFADKYNDREQAVTLWTYNSYDDKSLINEEGPAHSAYTRLGIQGSFQSWLNPFYADSEDEVAAHLPRYVVHGDYGLRLRIYASDETVSTDQSSKEAYYDMYLSCADMNGNPYNFQTFYQQEKVFDISAVGTIQKMELQFYQTPGTFVDVEGEAVPFKDFLDNLIAPNIFLKDPYISLGYDISEFDEEMVQIYTFDSKKYTATASPLTNNHKKIHLRWIHKLDDGSFMSVTDKTKYDYEVRWYRYELGHSSADEYSGVYWKNLSLQRSSDGEHTYEIQDESWIKENQKNGQQYQREPGFFSSWLLPDITLQNEQVKAIIIFNGKPYRSNILFCENEREVVNKATVEAVSALSIECVDDKKIIDDKPVEISSYGNYQIYNQGNSLIDYAQASVVREFVPYFKASTGTGNDIPTELIEAEKIEWIIPTQNTMIVIDEAFKSGGEETVTTSTDTDGRIHIVRYGAGDTGNVLAGRNRQKYKIKSYYSQTYSDNTIQCKVTKHNTVYTATKELTFGVAGTTGTEYTFILDFDGGVTAITNNAAKAVTVTARLYDYENKEIDLTNHTVTWGWKTSDGLLSINPGAKHYQKEIVQTTGQTWSSTNYNILKASITWGDWDLEAYLPIPIRSSDTYAYMSGTTQVIYNSAGEILDYFKNPFALYGTDAAEIPPDTISWSISNAASAEDGKYSPKITVGRDNLEYLTPLSFYVEGACEKVCVLGKIGSTTVWSQPLLFLRNKYPSAMVNKWDGQLKIDESSGSILAPRMVAGKKNTDNTFSGVMLGNWGDQNAENSLTNGETGLYGFDHGEQTYAFKEDGTAFIGKDGVGRISFNATEPGVITSGAYTAGVSGMQINLAQGTIDAHTFTLTAGKNNITPVGGVDNTILMDTEADEYPFRIGSNFYVDWSGNLTAQNASFNNGNFSGTIYGSTITGSEIYVPNETSPAFSVDAAGVLTATGAIITGTINATGGTITGDMTVTGKLSGGTIDGATITGGSLNIGSGNFQVSENGVLTARGGTIGGWTFGLSTGNSGTVATDWNSLYGSYNGKYTVLDPGRQNVIAVGTTSAPGPSANFNDAPFRVLYDGTVYMSALHITGGDIDIASGTFKVTEAGAVTCSNITVTGGEFTLGSNFKVSTSGILDAKSALLDGLTVDGTSTLKGTVTVSGTLKSGTSGLWQLDSTGISTSGNIKCTGLYINNKAYTPKSLDFELMRVNHNVDYSYVLLNSKTDLNVTSDWWGGWTTVYENRSFSSAVVGYAYVEVPYPEISFVKKTTQTLRTKISGDFLATTLSSTDV